MISKRHAKVTSERPRKGPGRPQMPTRERREQLLQASLAVFLEKGFHATRIEDIVAKARVGKGTFYLSFKDKEEAFSALLDPFFEDVRGALSGVFDNLNPKQSVAELFEIETRQIFSAFIKWKSVATLILREAGSVSPKIEKKLSQFYREIIETSQGTFSLAMGLKLLPQFNSEIAAACVMGAIEKVYELWLKGELKTPQTEAVAETSRFLQRGCGV